MNNFRFIAEIGGNHEGCFKKAKSLLKLVSESGASVAKFQIYTGSTLVNPKLDVQRVKHFDKFSLKTKEYIDLAKATCDYGLEFNASIWNLDQLDKFDHYLSFYKIGSGDLTAFNFLEEIAKRNKPIVLSTGLSTIEEVRRSVEYIRSINTLYNNPSMLTLLQCTSMYPISLNYVNLNVMKTLSNNCKCLVGYSDHTIGCRAVEIAYVLGASTIEVHFTDRNKNRKFRDHQVSFTKKDIINTLNKFKEIDIIKGSGNKMLESIEEVNNHHVSFRRGIYLRRDLPNGHICKPDDFVALRPLIGICSSNYPLLIGAKLKRKISKHEPLLFTDFEIEK